MTRRVLALLGGAATLLALNSCATFDASTAATVNGTDISVDELDTIRQALADEPATFALGTDNFDDTGAANGDLTRQALSLLIDNQIITEALERAGTSVSDDDLAAAIERMSTSANPVPEGVQEALAYQSAGSTALGALTAPDPATLQPLYEDRPASTGAVCLVVVSASTEAEANAAAATLEAGGTVEATDTVQARDGCAPVSSLSQAFAGDDIAFFLDAAPGAVSRVFPPDASGNDAWQVIQMQTWDDAFEQFSALVQQSPGDLAKAAAFLDADISVASEYGRWDRATQAVVAV